MNICMVCPYFQSKKYDMKLRTDVLEVSCRLVKHGHKVVVSLLERMHAFNWDVVIDKNEKIPASVMSGIPLRPRALLRRF